MAILQNKYTGQKRLVARTTWIGRSSRNDFQLKHDNVSAHHASLKWIEGVWLLRDRNSRNGTWVDGKEVGNEDVRISLGAELCFGDRAETWVFIDDLPTEAFASCGDEDRVLDRMSFVVFPDDENPLVTIYFRGESWVAESSDKLTELRDGDLVDVEGHLWSFHLPEPGVLTRSNKPDLTKSTLFLDCKVKAKDDEDEGELDVHISIRDQNGTVHELGNRVHNRILAELAHMRLTHMRQGDKPETEQGWMTRAQLRDRLDLTKNALSVQIYRARKQIEDAKFINSWSLFETAAAGHIRLGVVDLETTGV